MITAYQPEWNKDLRDFTQTEAQELVGKLKERGYTHSRIRIDLHESLGKVKGPVNGVPSEFHSCAFNLATGAIELLQRWTTSMESDELLACQRQVGALPYEAHSQTFAIDHHHK